MEKTGPTVCQIYEYLTKINWIYLPLLYLTIFSFFFCLYVCVCVCVCVFSATGAIQEEVVHTVFNEQKASIF